MRYSLRYQVRFTGRMLAIVLFVQLTGMTFFQVQAYAGGTCDWSKIAAQASSDSPILKSGTSEVNAQEALRLEAMAPHFPQIDLVARKGDSNTSVLNTSSRKEVEEYGFEINWALFEGFATQARIAKRKAEKLRAEASKNISSVELRYELRRAYFRNLVLQERITFTRNFLSRQKESLRLMEVKYRSGREPKWGVDKAKADLRLVQHQLDRYLDLLDLSRGELTALVGGNLKCAQVDGAIATILANFEFRSLDAKTHPEFKEYQYRMDAANEEARMARSDYFPKLYAHYSYKKQGNDTIPDPVSVSSWAFSLKFNIFDGLGKSRRIEAAQAKYLALELRQSSERLKLEIEAKKAIKEFKRLNEAVPLYEAVYRSAKKRVETVSKQYGLGLKKFIDWEQAQSKLADAEVDFVAAKAEALQALAEFERAYGLRLEEK